MYIVVFTSLIYWLFFNKIAFFQGLLIDTTTSKDQIFEEKELEFEAVEAENESDESR